MRYVKFTAVKLIIHYVILTCFAFFVFSENCEAKQKIAVQIAASKTPLNILDFAERKQIDDSIISKDTIPQKSKIVENSTRNKANLKKSRFESRSGSNYLLNLFFNDKEIATIKNNWIEYGNNHLPKNIRKLYIGLIEKSFQLPVIFFFSAFILFFIINILSVLLILNFTIKKKNQKERYLKVYGKMYEEILMSYMFGDIEWEKAIVKLKKIDRKKNRKILISILLNFHENLKGDVGKFIPEIFVKLGLQNDSLKAANSSFNFKKVQGIRELTYLYSEGAMGIVSDLINDSNDNVRSEAQIAFVRLNPDNPFKFLGNLTKPFTRWTQLSAFNLLRLNQIPVPSFAKYLYIPHQNVRDFCLRMIIYFQQLENFTEIFHMLDSTFEMTRFLSYRAINDLRLYDGRILVKQRFRDETARNKLEIVKALRNIGNEEDFDFLEIIIKSESISLKTEACRTMYYMNSEGRERLLKMNQESGLELDLFISHVTDPRN